MVYYFPNQHQATEDAHFDASWHNTTAAPLGSPWLVINSPRLSTLSKPGPVKSFCAMTARVDSDNLSSVRAHSSTSWLPLQLAFRFVIRSPLFDLESQAYCQSVKCIMNQLPGPTCYNTGDKYRWFAVFTPSFFKLERPLIKAEGYISLEIIER